MGRLRTTKLTPDDKLTKAIRALDTCGFRSINSFLVEYFRSSHGVQSLRAQPNSLYGPAAILDSWCINVPTSSRNLLHTTIIKKAAALISPELQHASHEPALKVNAEDPKLDALLTSFISQPNDKSGVAEPVHTSFLPDSFDSSLHGLEKFTKLYNKHLPYLMVFLQDILMEPNHQEHWRKTEKVDKEVKAYKLITVIISQALFFHNRATNAFQTLIRLFLAGCGASRRIVENLNHMGLSMSYATIQRSLIQLTAIATQRAQRVIQGPRLSAVVYDNINFTLRKASQRLDSSTQQLNATTLAVFLLPTRFTLPKFEAALSIPERQKLKGHRQKLSYADIMLTRDAHQNMEAAFKHAIRTILLEYTPGWEKQKKTRQIRNHVHKTRPRIRGLKSEKTDFFPLPALNEEEASVAGTIRVVQKIFTEQLGLTADVASRVIRFMVGDWLSIRNLRLMKDERADEGSAFHRFDWIEEASMPFHFQLNSMYALCRTHFGSITSDNPSSLEHHCGILRHAKLDVKKPEYNRAKELVTHSLIARIIDCTRIVLNMTEANELKEWSPDPEALDHVVHQVFTRFTTTVAAQHALDENDEIMAHSIFFICDSLIFWVFQDAVRHADIGRMWMVYDFWVFMMRGAGCNNYGNELLEMKAKFKYEYPPLLGEIIENTWLFNRWGSPGQYIPTDLYLEHNNGFTKNMFAAMGSGASIEHVQQKSSANVETLRDLAHVVSEWFGVSDYNRRHKEVSTRADIQALVTDMQELKVHSLQRNRHISVPKTTKNKKNKRITAVKDVLKEGRYKLMDQGLFDKWKKRTMHSGGEGSEDELSGDEGDDDDPFADPEGQLDVNVGLDTDYGENILALDNNDD